VAICFLNGSWPVRTLSSTVDFRAVRLCSSLFVAFCEKTTDSSASIERLRAQLAALEAESAASVFPVYDGVVFKKLLVDSGRQKCIEPSLNART
jgi:hypothetical protein